MRGVLARASGVDRPVRHHPAHAMPSPGRTKRIRTSGHDHGARHARVSIETRRSLTELRQRLTRLAHAPRIVGRVVAFADSHLSARHSGVRPVRTRTFRVALFICVVSTGFITAAPSLSGGDGGPLRASSVAHRPPLQIASGPEASRLNASEQQPKSTEPETAATPPVGGPRQERSDSTRGGLSLDMQTPTPPAPDDPDLEQALSGLDRQADLDQVMWQQRGLGDRQPTGPTAGPPAALPDGQAPVPPSLSTSSTNGLPPQVGPSTTTAPNAKPSGAHSGQRASSRWISVRHG
ncbi:MAG: hypothetical protein QOE48_6421 [Mycobacterium sp.]|jgi:hypothetical protein|nr:hypothetical protein [Mycobacterium sp.]MDT5310697.1 hypothetical protein [Mycobacterium sp.]